MKRTGGKKHLFEGLIRSIPEKITLGDKLTPSWLFLSIRTLTVLRMEEDVLFLS
jgi:hypothetical protein